VVALVPAAGRGERLGPGDPKAFRLLAGASLLVHAVRSLLNAPRVASVVIAVPAGSEDQVRADLRRTLPAAPLTVVSGGPSRGHSVAMAFAAAPPECDVVLVHDAARPLVPREVIDAVIDAVLSGAPAVVPVLPIADTVRRVDDHGVVVETPAREHLRAVQTPQGFPRDVLERAYAPLLADRAGDSADPAVMLHTDDAGLVERLGLPVHVVPGAEEAFKVTRPLDLLIAEAVLRRRQADASADGSDGR
jgi:2-C-methyl-D-erythritol 4-phosphate cytidylyltransferase